MASSTASRLVDRLLPLPGWLPVAVSTAALAGASTYAVGKVFIQHFESGGTFLTFDPQKIRDHYDRELDRGKEEVARRSEAVNKGGTVQ